MFESNKTYCKDCPAVSHEMHGAVCVRFDAPLKLRDSFPARCKSCKESYPNGIMWASLGKRE